MPMASHSIHHTIGVNAMPKTIRCPVCNTWKYNSSDAGPCDDCLGVPGTDDLDAALPGEVSADLVTTKATPTTEPAE